MTVAGISGAGIIENTETETTVSSNGTLTVNNAAGNSSRTAATSATPPAAAARWRWSRTGPARLTLTGSNVGRYTGGLTVNAGLLDYSGSGTALPNCNYTITGGTLSIGSSHRRSMKVLQIDRRLGQRQRHVDRHAAPTISRPARSSVALGGSVGFNKTTPGTVTFTKAPPNGPYSISDGTLVLGTLSKTMACGSLTMTGGTLDRQRHA